MNEIKSINGMPLNDTVARASIAELEDKINNIDVSNMDLSNYATKDEIPKNVSQLNNDEGYLTESEINELLDNVNTEKLAHVFLTKEEYNALTNEEKNDESKLYIITDADEVDISSYATKAYVDNLIGDVGALLDTLNGEVI